MGPSVGCVSCSRSRGLAAALKLVRRRVPQAAQELTHRTDETPLRVRELLLLAMLLRRRRSDRITERRHPGEQTVLDPEVQEAGQARDKERIVGPIDATLHA